MQYRQFRVGMYMSMLYRYDIGKSISLRPGVEQRHFMYLGNVLILSLLMMPNTFIYFCGYIFCYRNFRELLVGTAKVYRVMYGLPWKNIFVFIYDNISLFMVTHTLSYIMHVILWPQLTNLLKTWWKSAHFTIVAKDGPFSLSIVTSPQLICDVTRTRCTGILKYIRLLVLLMRIGAKLIFTSE